ncbi:MAG: type II secretion system F family protein [Ruminococcus sp.]|uniref:type II secretion system F family protein n=1 Tax=Ruminococcus sp. J1101004_170508_H5 TaxID=2787115 RepID=UPI001897C180|nr:type II secretion system F family protein [Ruminococcus sp. J1101004_170508_H5]
MATYKYTAISKDGVKVSGVVEGFNEFDAVDRIKQDCDIVLKLTEVEEKKPGLLSMEIGGNRLNAKAFSLMCAQFSIILQSGIPIGRTVRLIGDKMTDKKLKGILKKVAEDVEAGRSVAASFQERGGKLLPAVFIETIRAGEESGNLSKAFETMYQHYDKQVKMRAKVRNALIYPVFVLALAVVVVIVLMVKVVPTFMDIFASYDAELPLITQSLILISNFFRKYIFLIIVVFAAIALIFKLYANTEKGRMNVAKLALKIPVLGNVSLLSAASEFAANLTTLIGAGLQLTRAVSITARVINNYYISQCVGKMTSRLEEGHTLGECMREVDCLPDILVDMTAVGEETGELESTLHTVSGYYESELDMAVQDVLKKLEPTLLIGMAVIAGYIVLAVYIAMFQMYSVM